MPHERSRLAGSSQSDFDADFAWLCGHDRADFPLGRVGLAPSPYVDRWVYCSFNLQVDKSVDDLIALIERARRDGYTGIVLADYKFQVLYRVPDYYFRNVERVKAAAARAKIELIPAVFSIGYSNGILQRPQSRGGLAGRRPALSRQESRGRSGFPAGGPDQERRPRGDEQATSSPGSTGRMTRGSRRLPIARSAIKDLSPADSSRARSSTETSPNVRLTQTIKLRPQTGYRFSCWVKTRDLADRFIPFARARFWFGGQLTFHEGGLEPTQDWKHVEVVFNSLDQREANLYAGFWGAGKGQIWIDDSPSKSWPLSTY